MKSIVSQKDNNHVPIRQLKKKTEKDWIWHEPNDLVTKVAWFLPYPPQDVKGIIEPLSSPDKLRAAEKQRLIESCKQITALETEIVQLKDQVEVLKGHKNAAEAESAAWKDLVELFRDGHSDSESFGDACEAYDRLTLDS